MYILLVLREFGTLYGQQIVDKTGLKREEVWRNLKVLERKQILKKTKVGRVTYYEPVVTREVLEYVLAILNEGGPRRFAEKAYELIRQARKIHKKMNAVAKETDDYENEIVEMGETPYIETLENAKKWRAAKKENNRVKKKPSITLTSRQKEQNRGLLKKPRVLQTKQITLPSGLKPTIRKPTLFEISDIMRGIKHGSKESHSLSPDFKEAFERLLA